jgi:ribosomal protein S18 acetylase RimI-like enzyme
MEKILRIDDSKVLTDIINKAFMTVAEQFNFSKENASGHPAFIGSDKMDKALSNGLKMFGYETEDKIVGCVGYSHNNRKNYLIERLATLPEYRHLGIGRKLMEFIENEIKNIGGKIAEVHVVDKNIILREWYRKLGYVEIRIDEIKTLPFNSCVMIKEMEKK